MPAAKNYFWRPPIHPQITKPGGGDLMGMGLGGEGQAIDRWIPHIILLPSASLLIITSDQIGK